MTTYESDSGDITMALMGDCSGRTLSVFREEPFLQLVETIRSADVGVANAEGLFHQYEGIPSWDHGGTHQAQDPRSIEEWQWMGIKMVSCANNHSFDYGPPGVLANIANLERYGLAHAGTGRHLTEASSPAYLNTPRGRVALVSVTATLPAGGSYAADPRSLDHGRPGANMLRHNVEYVIPRYALDALREISKGLGFEDAKARLMRGRNPDLCEDTETHFQFLNTNFAPYPKFTNANFVLGEEYRVSTTPNQLDLERNLRWIKNARYFADWVLLSIHAHDCGRNAEGPPEFVQSFAHHAIDAGVDVFVSHGAHHAYGGSRGIEIYRGKPIFYGLGSFIGQSPVQWTPWDAYARYGLTEDAYATPAEFEAARSGIRPDPHDQRPGARGSAYVTLGWEDHKCAEIQIHPIVQDSARASRGSRGRPLPATGEVAGDILARFQEMCKTFDTEVVVRGEVGVIKVG